MAIGLSLEVDLTQVAPVPVGDLLVRADITWATGGGQQTATVDLPTLGTMIVVPAADGLQIDVTREGTSTLLKGQVQARATVGIASGVSGRAQRSQRQALPFPVERLPIPRFARKLRTYISSGNLVGDEVLFYPDRGGAAIVETAAPETHDITIPAGAQFWSMIVGGQPGGRIVTAVWELAL